MHLSLHDSHDNQTELYTNLKDLGNLTLAPKEKAVTVARASAGKLYLEQKDLAKACVTAFITGKKIVAALHQLNDKYINLREANGATLLHLTAIIQDSTERQKAVDCLLGKGANPSIRMDGGYTYEQLIILKTPPEQRNPEVKWQYNYVPKPFLSIFYSILGTMIG